MIKITVSDILKHCNAKLLIGNEKEIINECFTDSKKITENCCFFGIKGETTDGSLYYKEAFDNGASVCILGKIKDLDLKDYDDKTVIIANDTKEVLQTLAAYKRSLFKGMVIGITGSVGKTSTKELVSNVLEKRYKVLKTKGNENSQIGLPLTILRHKDEDVMVLEMGMNNKNEMHNLSMIAKPDIAVITNVFDSHIGNLGSMENILKAKLEILDGMNDGILIINNDNDMLQSVKNDIKKDVNVMTFGIKNTSNVMAYNIKEDINTKFNIADISNLEIKGGTSYVYNALVAFLIGKILGLSRGMIKLGINKYSNQNHRLEIVKINNNITLIDDSYNASYCSVKNALEYLKNFNGRKIAVLADILELGKESKKIHKKIGEEILNYDINFLITIGKYSKFIHKISRKHKIRRKHFKNELNSHKYIKKILKDDDIILIKGSNGMNLINLINDLKKKD